MKNYVLDTNVLLTDPHCITSFGNNNVFIPYTVLEELDRIKSRKDDVSRDARYAIRLLDTILKDKSYQDLIDGVLLSEHFPEFINFPDARLHIITNSQHGFTDDNKYSPTTDFHALLSLDSDIPDDCIIQSALKVKNSILVTRDINMRIKALSNGLTVEDYRHDIVVEDRDYIHTGIHEIENIFDTDISTGYNVFFPMHGGNIYYINSEFMAEFIDMSKVELGDYLFYKDEFILNFEGFGHINADDVKFKLTEEEYEADYCIFKYNSSSSAMNKKVWDIKSKNIHQAMAINSILDPDVHLTVLLGSAGTGKTLITIASALELVLEKKKYKRIIFSKTQDSQFEDIGFLPGTEEQKIIPFCGAAIDALEFLHKDDVDPEGSIREIIERNAFQFKALNFVRGRSFLDTILIIDEFQNLTPAMAKTILTRAGKNCKVIIMGNLSQIDNTYITPINSGLTYVTEKMKEWEGCRIVELEGVVRSPLAEYAEEHL